MNMIIFDQMLIVQILYLKFWKHEELNKKNQKKIMKRKDDGIKLKQKYFIG